MLNWLKRTVSLLLVMIALPAFATNMQDPYALVQDAAHNTFIRLDHETNKVKEDPNYLRTIVREELLPYVDNRFAAYKVIGKELRNTTPEQRDRFVNAFTDYIVATYADALGKYNKQTIQVERGTPVSTQKEVSVKVDILETGKPDINVVFQLRKNSKTGEWRVFDMVAEGISLLASKQSELGGAIRQKGIDSVSQMLEEHNKKPAVLAGS